MSVPTLPAGAILHLIVSTIFFTLDIIAVALRFWARLIQRKAVSANDYLIVASLVVTGGVNVIGYLLIGVGGVGKHQGDAAAKEIEMSLKLFVAAGPTWAVATALVKTSILSFYISIFRDPRLRVASYVMIACSCALVVGVFLQSFLICHPFAFNWNKTITSGSCADSQTALLAIAAVNLAIDLCILALPMPTLWKLQMSPKKKVSISAILAVGLVVCLFSSLRIKAVLDLAPTDFTYTVAEDLTFGALELQLGIINACLPLLRPIWKKLLGSSPWRSYKTPNSDKQTPSCDSKPHRPSAYKHLADDAYPLNNYHACITANQISPSAPDIETGSVMVHTTYEVRA
ncbi:hypothetical protein PG996_013732 [Apiospora saccharicola]|uniref:Rhodopsin domain-containing protein n=1 Tax=Apiospora saccharicola TaxID=335842 RepID=A0ABR1U690_9PEZI